jgi:hypothetical protein
MIRADGEHPHLAVPFPEGSSPLILFMILGIKKEKINRATEKNTLKEIRSPQFPEAHTSFTVPIKKVKIKVPTMMPRPVPRK